MEAEIKKLQRSLAYQERKNRELGEQIRVFADRNKELLAENRKLCAEQVTRNQELRDLKTRIRLRKEELKLIKEKYGI
jgi:hypothetical protein